MDDIFGVRRGQSVRDLLRVLERAPLWNCSLSQLRAQFMTLKQFGDDVWSALIYANIVDGQHIRMIQAARCTRFLLKAAQPVRIARIRRRKDFYGDLATQPRISCTID